MKGTKILKKEKGITLIALVVTIVVLLILAGISINAVLGNNGLITKAKETRLEQAHAQVRDAMALWYGDYQIEVLTAKDNGATEVAKLASLQVAVAGNISSFIAYLEANNIITAGIVNVEALLGNSISYGNGTGTSDVYKVEENGENYELKYYDKDGNTTLLDAYGETEISNGGTEQPEPPEEEEPAEPTDSKYFTFTYDETTKTATITGVKEEYANTKYYSYWGGSYVGGSYTESIQDGENEITDIVIPSTVEYNGETYTVTEIGTRAFGSAADDFADGYNDRTEGWTKWTSVVIPSSITKIGDYAFSSSYYLTSITIQEGVTHIGDYAFLGTQNLTNITLPESITSMGNYAFDYSSGLTKWYNEQPDGDVYIGKVYYKYKGTMLENTSIVIREGTNEIEPRAFYNRTALTSITIPESVTSIGSNAFYGCSGLTSIEIPNSITSIASNVFSGCSSLTSINIPEGVTSIYSYAFHGCSSLTSINIPVSVTSISNSAFSDCNALTSITVSENNTVYDSRENCNAIIETSSNSLILGCKNTIIPNNVTSIGAGAFSGCSGLTSINIPDSVTYVEDKAFEGCTELTSITVSENNTVYDSRENCNAIISTSSNTLILGCKNTTIPDGVTRIWWYAFYNYSGLTSIEIPDSVTSIKSYAFSGCSSLTNVTIDSEEIASSITYSSDGGNLIRYATAIYIKESIPEESIGSYIIGNYTEQESDKAGYRMYTK